MHSSKKNHSHISKDSTKNTVKQSVRYTTVEHAVSEQNISRTIAVIPCFNEEHAIGSVILKAKRYVDEIVVVDDGSSDNTKEIACLAGATVLSHEQNLGKSAGVKTGFQYALDNDFDYVITLDGDGQHNADEIPALLSKLRVAGDPTDICIGIRHGINTEMPLWRKAGKRVLDYATSFGNQSVLTDSQSGFRAFTKQAVAGMTPCLRGRGFSTESEQILLAGDLGFSIANMNISCKYKSIGSAEKTSTKNPTSHGVGVLGYVISLVAEKRPLLFIGVPGFALVLFSVYLAIKTLQYYNTTGVFLISYALLTSMFLLLGALAMFIGLLLNTIPRIIQRTLHEKDTNCFRKNNKK
jgi:glycosyltransferase involved in cell wall biosynthesis